MRGRFVVMAAVSAAMLASGCTRIRNNMGYIVDTQLVTSIQPGVDNKASVQQTLGRPSFNSEFDDRQWYYVSRNTRQTAFLAPKAFEQKIIIVSFDAQGNVAKVDQRGLEKVASINPSNDKTPTLGRKGGLLNDLFGNIGAVGPGSSTAGDPTNPR